MTWDYELKTLIKSTYAVGSAFTLDDVYLHFESILAASHPNNRHVRDKIRQVLQHLRDNGMLVFVDYDGTYRRRI